MIDDDGQPPIANGQMDKPLPTVEEFRDGLLSLDSHNLLWLPDFGVGHLTIKKAAELVAFDMWYSGEITDIEAPENWDGSEHDPKLLALLAQHVATFEARLLNAVDSGKIKATAKRRDFDERLNPEKTYIKNKKLIDWLIERGYEPGDIMHEWLEVEGEIAAHVCDELIYLRTASKRGKSAFLDIAFQGTLAKTGGADATEVANVIAAYKALIVENQQLKEQLTHARTEQPAKVDRPLATRQRRTLLTIIAALCEYSAIDPTAKNAAGQIAKLTEDIGANVTDETIAKAISEIPDALVTRMK